ncbi:hypothetical protein G7Y89_g2174 [Cudoniella acicularis]|uniref:Heterokaryon incompatibility domain-containing protein n=1 Tax=Cudoniella acicularis TaxID=354080 RepID=A0A8H4W6C1_9HELO|nr:hypothetical protein G7Y89_g2174 [Cudoniella acicularis]
MLIAEKSHTRFYLKVKWSIFKTARLRNQTSRRGCIIQDSTEDWQDHTRIMGEMYGNAFCNIAVCTGSDGTSGLFPDNDAVSRRVCTLNTGASTCLSGSFAVRDKNLMRANAKNATILSRGWCVQELMLAPRILHFSRGHTVWECSTLLAEDSAPTHQMVLADGYNFPSRKFKYMDVVTDHLSVETSAGSVARLIYIGLGQDEEYIAGLWKTYLAFHLVWDTKEPRKNYQLWPYRAPSWSWASVECPVYNFLTNAEATSNYTTFIQVSTEVNLATEDL